MYCICYKFEQFKPELLIDMQFLIIGYDGTDPEALNRKMRVREKHLEKIEVLKNEEESQET